MAIVRVRISVHNQADEAPYDHEVLTAAWFVGTTNQDVPDTDVVSSVITKLQEDYYPPTTTR